MEDETKFQSWTVRDAKTKFTEVMERSQAGIPQLIIENGQPQAVLFKVGSIEELEEILSTRKSLRRKTILNSINGNKDQNGMRKGGVTAEEY